MCGSNSLILLLFFFSLYGQTKPNKMQHSKYDRTRTNQPNIRCLKVYEKVLCSKSSSPGTFSNWFLAKTYNGSHSMAKNWNWNKQHCLKIHRFELSRILFPNKFKKSYFKSNHWFKIDLIFTYSANNIKLSSIYERRTLNAEHIKSKNALILVIEKMKFLKQNR